MIQKILLLIVLIFADTGFFWRPLFAGSYYLSNKGNDKNAGTYESPWATLNRAHTVIRAGDTLFVRGGIYSQQKTVIWTRSGTKSQPIVIQAFPGEKPVFSAGDFASHLFMIQHADWLVIDGLEATGYRCAVWMGFSASNPDYAENNVIRNNYFHDMKEHLIYLSWGIRNIKIYNNRLENPGNELGTKGYCIHGWHGPGVDGAQIFNNILVGGYGGIVFADGARNIEIYHNVLFDNFISLRFDFYGEAEGPEGFVKNVTIKNNIIYNTESNLWGLTVAPENANEIQIDYNIWHHPAGKAFINWSNTPYAADEFKANTPNARNSIAADPKFVDISRFDFNLQPGSVAIDQGVVIKSILTDIENISRPQGNGFDIGAYEFRTEISGDDDTTAPAPPTGVDIP